MLIFCQCKLHTRRVLQNDSGSGEVTTQFLRNTSNWSALVLEYVNPADREKWGQPDLFSSSEFNPRMESGLLAELCNDFNRVIFVPVFYAIGIEIISINSEDLASFQGLSSRD